jgi:hypothetical protein
LIMTTDHFSLLPTTHLKSFPSSQLFTIMGSSPTGWKCSLFPSQNDTSHTSLIARSVSRLYEDPQIDSLWRRVTVICVETSGYLHSSIQPSPKGQCNALNTNYKHLTIWNRTND